MRSRRLLLSLAGLAFFVGACSNGPGDRDDLVTALTRDDTFTELEASCIANAVFTEYGENEEDEEALNMISRALSYEELNTAEGVEGFDEFFENSVSACTNR